MAKPNATADPEIPSPEDEGWEDVVIGLGEEWDFDKFGFLVGRYIGTQSMDVPDRNNPGQMRTTAVHRFEADSNEDAPVFVWGSYQLDEAFNPSDGSPSQIRAGDSVRIDPLGTKSFSSEDGPRTLKQFRVRVKRAS